MTCTAARPICAAQTGKPGSFDSSPLSIKNWDSGTDLIALRRPIGTLSPLWSFASVSRCPRHVRSAPNSDRRADIAIRSDGLQGENAYVANTPNLRRSSPLVLPCQSMDSNRLNIVCTLPLGVCCRIDRSCGVHSRFDQGNICRQSRFMSTTVHRFALASSSALSSLPTDDLRSYAYSRSSSV